MTSQESLAAAKADAFRAQGAGGGVAPGAAAGAGVSASATGGDSSPEVGAAVIGDGAQAGKPDTSSAVSAAAASASGGEAADPKGDSAANVSGEQPDAGATASPAGSSADAPDPGDTRLLALAKQEQRNREQAKKQREELAAEAATQRAKIEAGERYERAQKQWPTDPLAALEALGFSADEVYAPGAIDRYLGRAKPPTPEELAERVVERKLTAAEKQRQEQEAAAAERRASEVRAGYIAGARATLRAEADKYPTLVRALGTGEVEADEIAEAGRLYHERTGKVPEFSLILGFLESELNPKSKQTAAPQVEAPKALPKPPVSTSHAPPAPARPMTREESLALAKREAGLSA